MAILDKLLEKKDLALFITYRLDYLNKLRADKNYFAKVAVQRRKITRARIMGRIKELQFLESKLKTNKLKVEERLHWKLSSISEEFEDTCDSTED